MEDARKDPKKAEYLFWAVSAFQSATRLFSVGDYAGAHTPEQEQAFAA
jgi:hypothetical protein